MLLHKWSLLPCLQIGSASIFRSPLFQFMWMVPCRGFFFQRSRGIWQGDILSPYLLFISMGAFSVTIDYKVLMDDVKLLTAGSNVPLFHTIFVDDVLVFCKAIVISLEAVEEVSNNRPTFK